MPIAINAFPQNGGGSGGGSGNGNKTYTVTVATTTNINLLSAPSTIDNKLLINGNTILVWKQTPDTGTGNPNNGIYNFNGVGNPLTRVPAFDNWNNFIGLFVATANGTTWGLTTFICNATIGGILGTTNMQFVDTKYGNITASGGVTKTGNNITLTGIIQQSHKFFSSIEDDGLGNYYILATQPTTSDINGLGTLALLNSINNSNWSGVALSIANGGTGQNTALSSFNALSPLYTLGDLLSHNGINNIVISGNTTTIKKFFSQVGNGIISALPLWTTLSFSDLLDTINITQLPNGGVNNANQLIQINNSNKIPALDASLLINISGILNKSANNLSISINGGTPSANINIISTNVLSSTVNNLTSTINGVPSNGVPIINTNTLLLSGLSLTSTINGIASNTQILGSSIPIANTLSAWDNNANLFANNFIDGSQTITTSNGTTVLTIASPRGTVFTGSLNQIVVLPNATTLQIGTTYRITNNGSGTITIQNNATTVLFTMVGAGFNSFVLNNNSNAGGGWSYTTISSTTNSLTSTINSMSSSVNGVASSANIINTNSLNLTNNALTSIINGITSNSVNVIATNLLTSSTNSMSSSVNGVNSATASIINSLTIASSTNNMSVTINGVASGNAPIINTNSLTLSGTSLTSTINGIISGIINVQPLIASPTLNAIATINTDGSLLNSNCLITTSSSASSNTQIMTALAVQSAITGAIASGKSFRGVYNASSNVFPSTGGSGTGGAIQMGDFWTISVAGTLGGVTVNVGDNLLAIVNTPGQTSSNWSINANGVASFNGRSGSVIPQTGDYTIAQLASIGSYTWVGNNGGSATNPSANSAGNLTEASSSVLIITNGANSLLNSASIQVKQANTSQNGFLSNTDWNTFNNKQNTLTNPVISSTATANINQLAVFTGTGIQVTPTTTLPTVALPAMTGGDVTSTAGSTILTVVANSITNAKLAQMPISTIKGNNTGSTANPIDLNTTQVTAMLNTVVGDSGTGGTKGLVPAPASGDTASGKFLKADGTWSVPSTSNTGGTIQATINSTLTAGSLVKIYPDNTVGTLVSIINAGSTINSINAVNNNGSNTLAINNMAHCTLGDGRLLRVYANSGSTTWNVQVGTATNGSVTWGSSYTVPSTYSYLMCVTACHTSNFVLAFCNNLYGSSNVTVFTIAGLVNGSNVVSFGAVYNNSSGGVFQQFTIGDMSQGGTTAFFNFSFLLGATSGSTSYTQIYGFNITTLTIGTSTGQLVATDLGISVSGQSLCLVRYGTYNFMLIGINALNTTQCRCVSFTWNASTSTFAVGNTLLLNSGQSAIGAISACTTSNGGTANAGTIVVITSSNATTANPIKISGMNISSGVITSFATNLTPTYSSMPAIKEINMLSNNTNSYFGMFRSENSAYIFSGYVSGGNILNLVSQFILGTSYQVATTYINYNFVLYSNNIFNYFQYNASFQATFTQAIAGDTVALDANNFIGILQTGGNSGTTQTVTVGGGINTAISGLTPQATYYINNSGILSTTPSLYPIGRAINATNLQLFSNDWLANLTTIGNAVIIANANTPSTSGATGIKGTVCWDTSYMYVCTDNNLWKRIALTTF